jgi:hypothetical protein
MEKWKYDLDAFQEFLPEAPPPLVATNGQDKTIFVEDNMTAIMKCDFIRWCSYYPAKVSEPLWYAMISNLASVRPGGVSMIHEFSKNHPGYTPEETNRKILHALEESRPISCAKIRERGFKCKRNAALPRRPHWYSKWKWMRGSRKMSNSLKYPLSIVKETTTKWLTLEDEKLIDVVCAAFIANQLSADPVWLLVIGPPSTAKTEVLTAVGKSDGAMLISGFTRGTLVSGLPKKKNMPEPSLVTRLNGKTLIVKEFSSVLSMHSEDQKLVLSQLREVYDGSLRREFGNGKMVTFEGKTGFIGAVTPAYDRHHGVIGSLGDRFILYRHHSPKPEEAGLKSLRGQFGSEQKMRKELAESFSTFLSQFRPMPDISFQDNIEMDKKLVSLATFCAHGRCAVERDRFTRTIEYMPEPEAPPRLAKQLKALGVGVALAYGKDQTDEDIYSVIKKVGLDLLESRRAVILKYLWKEEVKEFVSWQTTREIADAVEIPSGSARYILEDLQLAGLLNRRLKLGSGKDDEDSEGRGRKPYEWQIKQAAEDWIIDSQVLDSEVPF